MSYKTILVHVDETERAQERIRIAAQLALTHQAHLIGAATTGISRFLFQNAILAEHDPKVEEHLTLLKRRAESALHAFGPVIQKFGVTAYETRIVDDEAADGISLQARYSDLVILGQADPEHRVPSLPADFPEYVVLNAGRPVLIVPYAGTFDKVGRRILVAWDASMEATRAVTAAIPLLKHAAQVDIVLFNPVSRHDENGEQPGANIALFLGRHGIKVEVTQQRTDIDIGNSLLSVANDLASDMIVMGGYGHSRFRELLLGGATRTILKSMTVPVWMVH
jgi:nucleotide-binding universal stress UspA family protein